MAIATATRPFQHHVYAMFEDVDGRLGICTGTTFLKDRPIQAVRYRVSIHKTSDEYTSQFVGMGLSPSSRYSHVYMGSGREVQFPDWDTWELVTIEESCPKPKDGKEFTWQWNPDAASYQNRLYPERTGWIKSNHPRCTNCHETHFTNDKGRSQKWSPYHSPELTVAECGWCHRGGVCDQKGVCRPYSE